MLKSKLPSLPHLHLHACPLRVPSQWQCPTQVLRQVSHFASRDIPSSPLVPFFHGCLGWRLVSSPKSRSRGWPTTHVWPGTKGSAGAIGLCVSEPRRSEEGSSYRQSCEAETGLGENEEEVEVMWERKRGAGEATRRELPPSPGQEQAG